jgi:5'-3' exonuclease
VDPASVPDRLALVGDAADGLPGLPGWGERSAAAVLARYGRLEAIPDRASDWEVPGLRNAVGLAGVLRDRMADALLYRDLATLRTAADGVPIPETDVAALEWLGADRVAWESFCDEMGLPRLRSRPHRWRA